ncbi:MULTISPECIES: cytochrome P450 [Actinomadura]|uniref:Cytochrome P450 n=1 Tax=Actinomadura yumaensis TaxID=111807 RepID=A0ABW2CKL0_9ACTN|nr:cytochrome P450 [Actinomadura sp. J1-007]MWK36827.1 cytochrome P450 [Actinomadura sp. J1-007]
MTAYEADPIGFLTECQREYGDLFRFDTGVVVAGDPELIQRVLARTNRDSVPNANPLDGGRFPTPEQTRRWMRARQLALPIFRSAALPARLPAVRRALAADLDALDGVRFDPTENAWAVCVRALLPLYVPDPAPGLVDALLGSFDASLRAGEAAVRVPRWMPSRLRRRVRSADQRVRDEIAPMLAPACPAHAAPEHGGLRHDGSEDHEPPGTLLEHILAQPEPAPRDIAMGAIGFTFLGAIGTMGAVWCWLLYCLAAHPEAAERVRAEAAAASDGEIVRRPERALPYTHAFVHEVLRVYPPAWLLGRDAITDLDLGGHRVPAGTAIMFSPYLLHHDPRWWDAPERFDPERWLKAEPPHAPNAYLPFASGPRGCLGTHLGIAVLVLTAAHISVHQRLEAPGLDRVTPHFGPSTLTPKGMTCRLVGTS